MLDGLLQSSRGEAGKDRSSRGQSRDPVRPNGQDVQRRGRGMFWNVITSTSALSISPDCMHIVRRIRKHLRVTEEKSHG